MLRWAPLFLTTFFLCYSSVYCRTLDPTYEDSSGNVRHIATSKESPILRELNLNDQIQHLGRPYYYQQQIPAQFPEQTVPDEFLNDDKQQPSDEYTEQLAAKHYSNSILRPNPFLLVPIYSPHDNQQQSFEQYPDQEIDKTSSYGDQEITYPDQYPAQEYYEHSPNDNQGQLFEQYSDLDFLKDSPNKNQQQSSDNSPDQRLHKRSTYEDQEKSFDQYLAQSFLKGFIYGNQQQSSEQYPDEESPIYSPYDNHRQSSSLLPQKPYEVFPDYSQNGVLQEELTDNEGFPKNKMQEWEDQYEFDEKTVRDDSSYFPEQDLDDANLALKWANQEENEPDYLKHDTDYWTQDQIQKVKRATNRGIPDGYEEFPGIGIYKFHAEGASDFNEASRWCKEEGAHLAIANSEDEAKVYQTMWERHKDIHENDAYVGINKRNPENEFKTVYGGTIYSTGYVAWRSGQPDNLNGVERCVSFHRFGGYNDISCYGIRPFICELH